MVSLTKPSPGDTEWSTSLNDNWTSIENVITDNAILTAKGDLLSSSASATPVRVAAGLNGKILVADSAQAAGITWSGTGVARQAVEATTQTVGNSTSEISIFSKTIPANAMGSSGMLRLRLSVRAATNGGLSGVLTFKFGGSIFMNHSPNWQTHASNFKYLDCEAYIENKATNSQRIFSQAELSSLVSGDGSGLITSSNQYGGRYSLSIDTTADQLLEVTMQWTGSAPNRNPSLELFYASVELVQ